MISPISKAPTLSALFALKRTQQTLFDTMQRLATGRRINSGKDDPAGLIAAERLSAELAGLSAQTRSLERADANANISAGHAAQLSSLYVDLRTLAVSSANQGALSDAEVAANQTQVNSIVNSIQRFTGDTVASLDGFNLPGDGNAELAALFNDAAASAGAIASGGANDLSSGNFDAALTALDTAITNVATARGRIGGFQKDVIGPQIRFNLIATENLSDARSRIVDTDYALETANFALAKVLQTSGIKVLKSAQHQLGSVLDLLT